MVAIATISKVLTDLVFIHRSNRTGGEKCAQPVAVANARCPQKMLKFYESHLKWRSGQLMSSLA
jgi:hypothetical protein